MNSRILFYNIFTFTYVSVYTQSFICTYIYAYMRVYVLGLQIRVRLKMGWYEIGLAFKAQCVVIV